jgi:hypothetical protein
MCNWVQVSYYIQTYTLRVHDITADKKNADNLLKIVLGEIDYCNDELEVEIIGWCSDAGGDSKSMRVKLHDLHEWLITLDCWTHQVSFLNQNMLQLAYVGAEQPGCRRLLQVEASFHQFCARGCRGNQMVQQSF